MTPSEPSSLQERIDAIGSWYHAIELGGGVRTPGAFDMSRFLAHYHFPESMDGMRVLDVGTSNGYFAFEFERRGADEVVALELPSWAAHDWTPRYREAFAAKSAEERAQIDAQVMRDGFQLVGEALGSQRVRKVERTIYDIDPGELGEFDLVFCGSMLMHVRDPILAVQRMRGACRGKIIVSIATTLEDSSEPIARFVGEWNQCNWWQPNPACLKKILECCDFEIGGVEETFVLTDVSGEFKDPTFVCHARVPAPRTPGA